MTTALTVFHGDKRAFIDRVIEYADKNNLLPNSRKYELVEQCASLIQHVCSRLKTNVKEMQYALEAAEIIKNFVSVALEALVGIDLKLGAFILLTKSARVLFFETEKRIIDFVDKQKSLKAQIGSHYVSRQWGMLPVLIVYATNSVLRRSEHILVVSGFQAIPNSVINLEKQNLYKKIRFLIDICKFEFIVSCLQEQLLISKKFVPWKQLLVEARLFEDRDSLRKIDIESPYFAASYTWSLDTMLMTMAASLINSDAVKTVLEWRELRIILDELTNPLFRKRGFELLLRYFEQLENKPDEREIEILRQAFEESYENFADGVSQNKEDWEKYGSWMHILHVSMDEKEYIKASVQRQMGNDELEPDRPIHFHEIGSLLSVSRNDTEDAELLNRLDWDEVADSEDGMWQLIDMFKPEILLKNTLLESEIVIALARVWHNSTTKKFREAFSIRVFREMDKDKIIKLDDDTLHILCGYAIDVLPDEIPLDYRVIQAAVDDWELVELDISMGYATRSRFISSLIKRADYQFWKDMPEYLADTILLRANGSQRKAIKKRRK